MAEVQRCFLPASQSHGLSMKGCRSTVRTQMCIRDRCISDPPTLQTAVIVQQLLPDGGRSAALAGPICTAVTHRRTSPLLS